jgi:hypothetical protein
VCLNGRVAAWARASTRGRTGPLHNDRVAALPLHHPIPGIACLMSALALAACAIPESARQDMTTTLADLVGKDIHAAIARFGSPSERRVEAGEALYTWGFSHSVTIPQPDLPTVTSVTSGGIPVFTMIPQPPIMVFFDCTIELKVDSEGKIKSYSRNDRDCD